MTRWNVIGWGMTTVLLVAVVGCAGGPTATPAGPAQLPTPADAVAGTPADDPAGFARPVGAGTATAAQAGAEAETDPSAADDGPAQPPTAVATAVEVTTADTTAADTPTAPPADAATSSATPSASAASDDPAPPEPSTAEIDARFEGLTIPDLRARDYGTSGAIEVGSVLVEDPAFVRYFITYPSDGLTISGMANVPRGDGPFPVVVLNHGYIAPSRYWTGAGSHTAADFLARQGFLTISPDYRGLAQSDDGPNPFRKGYVIDVLNLVALIDTLPQADAERIAMWGHSMGGGIAKQVMVVSDAVDAFALYGAMSDDAAENWRHIRTMWNREAMDELAAEYAAPDEAQGAYRAMSPRAHLEHVSAPVIIHHGTADSQVPVAWSERLARELDALGKPVTLHIYQGQPHSFQGQAWTTFMQRTADFFRTHLTDG